MSDEATADDSGKTPPVKTHEYPPVSMLVLILVVIFVAALCTCILPSLILETPIRLLFGWAMFLARVLPQSSFSFIGLISAVACVAAFALLLRLVLRRGFGGATEGLSLIHI